jgi:hypothetical protein
MENQFEEFEGIESYTDSEIFTKIWTKPRQIFSYIQNQNYNKYLYLLLAFMGISRAFSRASMKSMGDDQSLLSIIMLSIILGGLLGWISYYIYAALLSWTGKWLNGKSNTSDLLRVLTYASIPAVIGLLMLIPQISIYGIEIFKDNGDISSAGMFPNIITYGAMAIEIGLAIWTIVLIVIGISEIQQISISKALLNLILPILVIIIPILLLVLIFKGF